MAAARTPPLALLPPPLLRLHSFAFPHSSPTPLRHRHTQLRAGNVLGEALAGEEPFDAIHVGAGECVGGGSRAGRM